MSSFLIVDADRNFREALAIALRLDGHDAVVAATAADALRLLEAATAGCCVLDAHLDGADEVGRAAAARSLRVVVTGPYPELLASAARRHPSAELLPKPFLAAELLEGPGRDAARLA
jgi:DNA-binding NtrC family response regulator